MKIHHSTLIIALAAALSAASCGKPSEIDVVPYPNYAVIHKGGFDAAGASFHISSDISDKSRMAIEDFAEHLSLVSGRKSDVTNAPDKGFVFEYEANIPEEGYELDIKSSGTNVKASSFNGFLYAIETIRQMLPVGIYGNNTLSGDNWILPCATIKDAPRFPYRGQHIDVARHFFGKEEMKKVIDMMLIHKMNTLHWHLTDDQGWRIEIKKYPKLTSVGGWRKGTVIRKDWDSSDGIRYGGFYTQEDIKEIISYADSKGITVIPEIDLPGHMLAALTAYPEYGCTGGPYEVWKRWGVADDVLCAGNEKTMQFLENILAEVAELFPSKYIHIGGDECPKVRWEKCPVCQAKIKELGLKDGHGYTAEHFLQSYVMERMENFLATKGKKIIGWDEILEGKPGPDATIMSWRGSQGGIKASKMGHDVIMTPNSHFYFDYYQSKDIDNEPFGIGGYVPVEMVYAYEPFSDDMDDNARSHILGVQANLWTEYVKTPEHLEYMLYPRQAALAEVQWCNMDNRNWERFLNSMSHEAEIYDILGYNYAKHVFQVNSSVTVDNSKECVTVSLFTQGNVPIRYTLDGSEPDANSTLYTKPIEIRSGCTLKATAERSDMKTKTLVREFCENKALGKKIVLNTQPHIKYKYDAPNSLIDGVRGNMPYSSGEWVGWYKEPLSVTIDMGGKCEYHCASIGAMSVQTDDVFPPLELAASISEDGSNFTKAGNITINPEPQGTADGLRNYSVEFAPTTARFIKVEAKTVDSMPQWHRRAGLPGFLFVDEVIVN